MTDDDVTVNLFGKIPVSHFKPGEYTLVVPLPDKLLTLIGLIVVQWGAFELRMDASIEMVIPRLHKNIGSWRKKPFKQRKKLFKKLMSEYTQSMFPKESETFISIADKAGELQWKRNAIAHGFYKTRVNPDLPSNSVDKVKFFTRAEHNGNEVILPIEGEELTKLWSDISHLGGNLMAALHRMGASFSEYEILIEDEDIATGQVSSPVIMYQHLIWSPVLADACSGLDAGECDCTA